jgi:hypothetical protein
MTCLFNYKCKLMTLVSLRISLMLLAPSYIIWALKDKDLKTCDQCIWVMVIKEGESSYQLNGEVLVLNKAILRFHKTKLMLNKEVLMRLVLEPKIGVFDKGTSHVLVGILNIYDNMRET